MFKFEQFIRIFLRNMYLLEFQTLFYLIAAPLPFFLFFQSFACIYIQPSPTFFLSFSTHSFSIFLFLFLSLYLSIFSIWAPVTLICSLVPLFFFLSPSLSFFLYISPSLSTRALVLRTLMAQSLASRGVKYLVRMINVSRYLPLCAIEKIARCFELYNSERFND